LNTLALDEDCNVSRAVDFLSIAAFVAGAVCFMLVLVSLADRHDLAALYWLALGVAALRASGELLGSTPGSR
jgi:hypothetical protein